MSMKVKKLDLQKQMNFLNRGVFMKNLEHKVVLVVDPNFGEKAIELACSAHVWIVASPGNNIVAESLWKDSKQEFSINTGISTFEASPNSTPEDTVIDIIDTIDEHHDSSSGDFSWKCIEVYGTELTPQVRKILETYGVKQFNTHEGGFRGIRSDIS